MGKVKKNFLARDLRDRVFRDLFSEKEMAIELYNELCPDNKSTKIEDIDFLTINAVDIYNRPYNDLAIIVKGRQVLLTEAQTNIDKKSLVRFHFYHQEIIGNYFNVRDHDWTEWGKILELAEFFIICSGVNEKEGILSLRSDVFENKEASVDLTFKKITKATRGSILDQYFRFCRAFTERIDLDDRSKKNALDFIDYCIENEILVEYLSRKREEVVRMVSKDKLRRVDELTFKREIEDLKRECELKGQLIGEKRGEKIGEIRGERNGEIKGLVQAFKSLGIPYNDLINKISQIKKDMDKDQIEYLVEKFYNVLA